MRCMALAMTLALLLWGPSGPEAQDVGTLTLEVQSERFTLRAKDVPLTVILEQLARAVDITVHLRAAVEERLSVELTNVSFDEGLRYLLQHRNSVVLSKHNRGTPSVVYVLESRGRTLVPMHAWPSEALAGASTPAHDSAVDVEAETITTAQIIEAFEADLRATAGGAFAETPGFLQTLLTDPEPSVRITALHWVVDRGEAGLDALALAWKDPDPLVQSVAMQMLLEREVDDQAVEIVRRAAEVADAVTIRQMLRPLLCSVRKPSPYTYCIPSNDSASVLSYQ
jgi:hypothetical protein